MSDESRAQIPRDIEAALLRGIGAYVRATPRQDLPAPVRPLKGLRQQALGPHRATLLALLEDETTRALMGQWMNEDKPSLAKADQNALRIAIERQGDWAAELTGLSEPSKPKRAAVDRDGGGDRDELERLRARLDKAREETRRVREETAAELAALRSERTALSRDLAALRTEIADMRKALKAAEGEAAKLRAEADRYKRRFKSLEDKSRTEREELKARHKEEVAALRAGASSSPKKKKTTTRRSSTKQPPSRPEKRRALAVPKGRLEDDPLTLDEWLKDSGAMLLVDGYNVARAQGGFGDLELADQRERVVDGVERLARRRKFKAIVVFDGSVVAPGTNKRRGRGPVEVQYSKADEIADDHLVALLESLSGDPVILATNDRELRDRAARLGATPARSEQLLALIR